MKIYDTLQRIGMIFWLQYAGQCEFLRYSGENIQFLRKKEHFLCYKEKKRMTKKQ